MFGCVCLQLIGSVVLYNPSTQAVNIDKVFVETGREKEAKQMNLAKCPYDDKGQLIIPPADDATNDPGALECSYMVSGAL